MKVQAQAARENEQHAEDETEPSADAGGQRPDHDGNAQRDHHPGERDGHAARRPAAIKTRDALCLRT